MGNSLTVECLGPRAFNAEGPGSIPGQGTKIPQAMQWSKKTNENKKERKNKQKKPGGGSALQSESQSPVKSLKCSLWLLLPSYWSEHVSFSPSLILFQPHWPSLWSAKMSGAYTYFFYSWNALHICICIETSLSPSSVCSKVILWEFCPSPLVLISLTLTYIFPYSFSISILFIIS